MKKTLHYAFGVLLACLLVGCASTPISSNTPGVQSLDESIRLAAHTENVLVLSERTLSRKR
jgi:uncharacterized lipoprotein YbaY